MFLPICSPDLSVRHISAVYSIALTESMISWTTILAPRLMLISQHIRKTSLLTFRALTFIQPLSVTFTFRSVLFGTFTSTKNSFTTFVTL